MSKNISLSDDVFEALVRVKGDRSFSEVIADILEADGTLQEVTGQQILDESTYEEVKADNERLSVDSAERVDM